jgi:phosphatidate cytidylyltransferase
MLRRRVLTAAAGAPILLLALYLGSMPYIAVVAVVAAAGVAEVVRLVDVGDRRDGGAPLLAALVALVFGVAATGRDELLAPGLIAGLFVVAIRQALLHPRVTTGHSAGLWLAALYLGLCFGHFPALRQAQDGLRLTVFAFALTWCFDSVAYFAGIRFGSHKLMPRLSPGKSWEGAVAGGAATLALAATPLALWPSSMPFRLAAALIVITLGQAGDLFESSLKRNAAVKDSGTLLPGHGGVLDRFDSLMFVVPAVYYLARAWPPGWGS